jgi:HEAT repeat protein
LSALETLWLASLLLAGIALLVMTGLIISRMVLTRRRAVDESERRRQIALLLSAPRSRAHLRSVEPAGDLLTDVAIEIVQLVRGEEREDFLASATRLGVPDTLRHRLKSGRRRVRLAAAEALGHFPDPESRAALSAALDDPGGEIRLTAALALAAAGEAPPADQLVRKLGIGTREQSLLALSLMREIARKKPDEVKGLVLDPATEPHARASAIEALSASGDYSLVPVIARLAIEASPNSDTLPRLIEALGRFGHPAGGAAVTHHLAAPDAAVRAAAAEAAGRIGIVAARETLGALLADPDWWVRLRAGQALARLGPTGEALLEDVARNGTEPARRTAALTLAERRRAP